MRSSWLPLRLTKSKDWYYFITYGISFIALGLAMSSLGPMLPYLADRTGANFSQISFIFTAHSLGYLIGSAGGGRLYDRFKSHTLMASFLVLMIITTVGIPLISKYYLLLFVMFFFGLGTGFLDIGGNVNILWVYQSRVGPYMNALHFFFGVGAFLSPLILHRVMAWTNGAITWPYWVIAILYIPSLVGLLLLKSPTNPEKDAQTKTANKIDMRLVILLMALFFLYVGVEGGYGGWIFTYATEEGIATETAASYLNSIYWGTLTLGRLISIPLAKRFKPSQILFGNYGLTIFFLLLILIWPTEPIVVWLVTAGLGLAVSSVFPTLLSLAETRITITGKVTSYFFLGSSSGAMIVPMIIGQIFEYIGGYQIMVALFIGSWLGLIVLVYMLMASKRVGEKIRS